MEFIKCENMKSLTKADEVLLISVLEWYNEDYDNVVQFMNIVKRKNGMSLRVIDWLVTNFSKSYAVTIETKGIPRDLNRDYQKNLSAYNKRNMDPFARRNKIVVTIMHDNSTEEKRSTTVGQLNFFRWFGRNKVAEYLVKNRHLVECHMKDTDPKRKCPRKIKKIISSKTYQGKFVMNF